MGARKRPTGTPTGWDAEKGGLAADSVVLATCGCPLKEVKVFHAQLEGFPAIPGVPLGSEGEIDRGSDRLTQNLDECAQVESDGIHDLTPGRLPNLHL